MEKFSQIGQDIIVRIYFNEKLNGTFLDIGCGYPKKINNTYLLEKDLNWDGISIDLENYVEDDGTMWEDCRKQKEFFQMH